MATDERKSPLAKALGAQVRGWVQAEMLRAAFEAGAAMEHQRALAHALRQPPRASGGRPESEQNREAREMAERWVQEGRFEKITHAVRFLVLLAHDMPEAEAEQRATRPVSGLQGKTIEPRVAAIMASRRPRRRKKK